MKIEKICIVHCAAICTAMCAAVSPASAAEDKVIDVYQAIGKGRQSSYTHPVIEVEGNGRGKYGSVKTRELWAWVTIRGRPPENADKYRGSNLNIAGYDHDIDRPGSPVNKRFAFPYVAPYSEGGTQRLDPVALCNEEAQKGSEKARERFVNKGGDIVLKNAYPIVGTSWWELKKAGFNDPAKDWESKSAVNAVLRCLPTGHFAATSTPGATRRPQANARGPSHSEVSEAIGHNIPKVSIAAAPMNVQRTGNWMCPTELRLTGRIDVKSKFLGDSIFLGPQWLSEKTRLEFTRAGGRSIIGVYPLNWSRTSQGSLTSATSDKPLSQTVNMRFNVANQSGKLVGSAQKNVKITCRKPAPGAGENRPGDVTG